MIHQEWAMGIGMLLDANEMAMAAESGWLISMTADPDDCN
jgi:hypothetical protein